MKNILFLLLLTINLFASSYTDDFSTSNSNWTTITGCSSMSFSGGTFNSSVAWSRNGAFFNASDITADSQMISSNIYYTTAVIQTYLAARIQPNVQTCYYFGFYNNSSEWRIGKLIKTANYTLSSASMSSKPSGTKFSLRVWDDSIVGYIDDIPVDTVIDSDIQSGYAGYYVYATDNPGRYDNFNLVDNIHKVPATITSQPRDTSVDETTSALFNITADGTGLSYQWIRNNSNVGGNANSYSFTTAMSNNGDSVWCIVSADTGSPVTSTKAYLTVTEFNGESFDSTEITSDVGNTKECPVIAVQPESDTVAVGSDTLLSFIVQAFGSNLTYQWKFNGTNVGSNVNYYQRVGAKADSGKYVKCVISGDTCSPVTTDSVLVAVIGQDAPTPPVITLQPRDTTVNAGSTATFTVSATNATNYQWWVNDIPVNGATNPSYSFTATSGMNGYQIYCAIWNDYDFVHTDTVTLTVNPVVTFNQSVDTLNLVCANNVNVQSWQWYKDNVAINGATDSVLQVIVDSTSAAKSVYYCKITNGSNSKKVGDWTIERKSNGRVVSRKNKYR